MWLERSLFIGKVVTNRIKLVKQVIKSGLKYIYLVFRCVLAGLTNSSSVLVYDETMRDHWDMVMIIFILTGEPSSCV